MTQRDLERELARTTGETTTTIRQRGFSLIAPPDLEQFIVDWDELAAERTALFPDHQGRCRRA